MSVFVPPTGGVNSDPIQVLANIVVVIAQQAAALKVVTALVEDPATNPALKTAILPLVETIKAQVVIASAGLNVLETAVNAMGSS